MPARLPRTAKTFRLLSPVGRVFAVDGLAARALDAGFIGGGHHLWRSYIPKGEVWVEKSLRGADGGFILAHEMFEWVLMHYRKWTYDRAHEAANAMEGGLRLVHSQAGTRAYGPDYEAALAQSLFLDLQTRFPKGDTPTLHRLARDMVSSVVRW